MDIHIQIDDRLVGFLQRLFRRRVVRVAVGLAVLASAGLLYAQTMNVFTPGTVISSSQVNANFTALADLSTLIVKNGTGGVFQGDNTQVRQLALATLPAGNYAVTARANVFVDSLPVGDALTVECDLVGFGVLDTVRLGSKVAYPVSLHGVVVSPSNPANVFLNCYPVSAASGSTFIISSVRLLVTRVNSVIQQ